MTNQLSPETNALVEDARKVCREYMNAVTFLALDASRDPDYGSNNLLVLAIEDHFEASVGLPEIASLGLVNTCRRELRFLLEASIKLCYAQQALPDGTINDKLASLARELDSPSIGLRRRLSLSLLPEHERDPFALHVGRLYGEASSYVHLTQAQVLERDQVVRTGGQPLTPSAQLVESLLSLMNRILSASFVYVAHSVPSFAVGDLLVQGSGASKEWSFCRDRWIALLDEHFDYKQERQSDLAERRHLRWSRVAA